jgi:DNA-binding NarL/FixJ family response regulator
MSKRIIIIEDQEDMQVLYRYAFRKEPDFEIVAQESDAENALEIIPLIKPDIAIIDLTLPGISGLDLTKKLHVEYPEMKIIIVTGHDRERFLRQAKEAGADNLLTKSNTSAVVKEVKRLFNS